MSNLSARHAFGLVTLLTLSLINGAIAADIRGGMQLPPPMPSAENINMDINGFYLRGDVGSTIYDHSSIVTLPLQAGLKTVASQINATGIADIGVGYQINSFVRTDVTGEYRPNARYSLLEVFNNNGSASYTTSSIRGFVGLANGYIDVGTWNRMTPFVGIGIGFASITTSKVFDRSYGGAAGSFGFSSPKTETVPVWALHAGVGYDLTQNWKAEAGYRYLHIGNIQSGKVACTPACIPFTVRVKDASSHDLRVGVRYLFSEMSMMPIINAPATLIRKY